jgi:hypothetical protein
MSGQSRQKLDATEIVVNAANAVRHAADLATSDWATTGTALNPSNDERPTRSRGAGLT